MNIVGDILSHSIEQREVHSQRDSSSSKGHGVLQSSRKKREVGQIAPRVIKEWHVMQGTLRLLAASHQPLSAQLEADQKMISIGRECIMGIPASAHQHPSQLEIYLKDSYARLVPVGQGEYHIQVSHGLKGGMEEEKVPASLFRRQMTTSSSSASSSSQTVVIPPCSDVLPFSSSVASSSSYDVETSSSSSSSSSSFSSDVLPFGRELPPELIGKLKMAVEQAKQAQGKDIIAFVGVTGSGKSTAINHLLGCEMEEKEIDGLDVFDVKDPTTVFTKIGHSAALSETEWTLLCQRPDFPYVFADCGGFLDTRGDAAEILTSTSMKLTLENAKSVKVVLCVPYNSLMDQKAIGSTEALRALSQLLVDMDAHKCSVSVLLTKPPMIGTRRKSRLATIGDAKLKITKIISELEKHVQVLQAQNSPDVFSIGLKLGLYQFLLRDEGKYLAVYDPVEDASRETTLSLFDQMEPIEEPKGKFLTTLSDRTALHLSEQITGIAGRACPLYESLLHHRDSFHDIEANIGRLTEQMQSMNRLIDEIGNETNDPVQIEAQQNAVRNEQTVLIEQYRTRIAQIDGESGVTRNRLNEVIAQIADKETRGDEPELYYTESIDNLGWNAKKFAVMAIAGPLLYEHIASKNSLKKKAFNTLYYESLDRVFRYDSPAPLLQVKLSPSSIIDLFIINRKLECWFNQSFSPDRTSHTVQFHADKGYAVEATVEYILRRRDIPNEITEMNVLREQKQQLQDRLARLTQSKENAEAEIRAAQEIFNVAGTALENLERYKAFRDSYPQRIQDLETRLTSARAEEASLQQQIESQKADFQFARDYLDLSGDAKLLANVMIKRFLDLDQRVKANPRLEIA